MSATKVPSIPAPTDANLRDVARAVKGVLDVREGLLGDPLDRFVTLRELVDGGLAGTFTGSGGRLTPTTPVGTDPGAFETYDPTADLTIPPPPEGFVATGLFAAIKLDWLAPQIKNYAYTEIWRSDINALGTAVLIGTSNGTSFTDYLGTGATRFYWARFVSQANVTGPYNSTNGTSASTAQDPEYLLEVLTGEITETQLYQDLGNRINLIDGPNTLSGSVNARVKVVQDIASVKNRSYYTTEPPVSTAGNPLVLGDLWFDTNDSNRLYRWNGSAWDPAADTRVGSLVTGLDAEVISRVNGDLAETRRRDALYAASFAGSGNNYKFFVQESQPAGTEIGDIWSWVNTTTGAVTFRRFNGSAWIDSSSNRRAATYKGASSTPPAADLVIGDLYFDTDDKRVYVFNGSAWTIKQTTMPDVAAFVYSEEIARVDADGALGQRISTVSATKTRTYYQTTAPTGTTEAPLVEGDLWFDIDDSNRVYRWSGTAWQNGRDGSIAIVDARVTNVEEAKIGYCKINNLATDHADKFGCEAAGGTWVAGLPLATAVKQVAVTDGSTTATLEQRFTAQKGTNNQLLAQYSVKIDNNGHVSGFGLSSTAVNGVPTSAFIVRADRFALAGPNDATDPLGTLNPTRLPFIVATSPTTINGVAVPAGTYINTAFIGSATITKAQIGSIYADRIDAGYTSSVDLESSTFYGSEFYIGGTVTYEFNDPQRPTQKTGIATVSNPNIALKNTGAEFNVNFFKIRNGTDTYVPFQVVNGVVNIGVGMIGDGTITNAKIGNFIRSTNYSPGSQGWIINKDGTAEFGAASIRGQLTASQIDSRNLTIRDASGNILFGAGANLPINLISGLGSLASKNSVSVGSGEVSGLGSLATKSSVSATSGEVTGLGVLATRDEVLIGQHVKVYNPATNAIEVIAIGDFVNRLSKINNSNISTFMESAAIGNAYIGNAAVGTLNIAGEAVTIPVYAEGFLPALVTDSWSADIASASFNVSGLDPSGLARVAVTAALQAYPTDASAANLEFGIFASGTFNTASTSTLKDFGISVTTMGSFLVPNGTHTVSVRVRCAPGAASSKYVNMIGRFISLTVKR